jgi:hypothetical protein
MPLYDERQISSAVSAVLRCEDFSCSDAVGADTAIALSR